MGTDEPDEIFDEEQIKTSKVGMSKCVFTKKYYPDGIFDKYKCQKAFRCDRRYDLCHNKIYVGCVMSETVRAMLTVTTAEDMEIGSLDVTTAFLYSAVPDDHYLYMRRPAGLIVLLRKCLFGLPHAPANFKAHSDITNCV